MLSLTHEGSFFVAIKIELDINMYSFVSLFLANSERIITFFKISSKTPPKNRVAFPVIVKGKIFSPSPILDSLIKNREVRSLVSGLKSQAKLTPSAPRPPFRGDSDNTDESESGLHPEGGDDRYKVGILL